MKLGFVSGAGHISAIVSEVSPTKSRDRPNSTGSVRSLIKRADHAGLGMLEHEIAGQRRERIAALGIGRVPEIIRHQPQLVVAAGLVGEPVEQFGEAVHDGKSPCSLPASPALATPSVSSSSP